MRITIMLLFLAALVMPQGSNEWPIPHNIGHTGFSPTSVLKPPFKVKWKTKVPLLISGESGNGPVVAEGKVVILGHSQQLVCLDAKTGELVWRYSIPQPEFYYRWHFYPCIAHGKVYAVFSVRGDTAANGIRCLDLNTGELLWKRDAGIISTFRMKDSPQYSKGKVFLHSLRDVNRSTVAQADFNFKSQVQAWDAVTGDSLWTYTMRDSIPGGRTKEPGEVNPALCVVGDTLFASCGVAGAGGRTVALTQNGGLIWSDTAYHVDNYVGNIQYTGDKLIILGKQGTYALNPRNGARIYTAVGCSYSKVAAIMNDKYWLRGYGGTPVSYNLNTGGALLSCKTITGDAYGSGCSAPRAANGYIYSGMGNPAGNFGAFCAVNDFPKLYAWDEQGNPVWWFSTPDSLFGSTFGQGRIRNGCQAVAIANDNLFWISNLDGWVYCFENDTRVISSHKAICLPETLEQYRWGDVRAVTSYTDGSKDTTSTGCLFSNLDASRAVVRVEGIVYALNPGTALVQVNRFGVLDTARIPIIPSKALLDSPVFIRRINFQNVAWYPFKYGWLADKGTPYTPAQRYGWLNVTCPHTPLSVGNSGLNSSNFLLQSYVFKLVAGVTQPIQYKVDAPNGDYIIRIGMGYNSYGVTWYNWTTFAGDTICRKPAGVGNAVCTDTIHVTGGAGITLTVNGAICYLVICSAGKGLDICKVADDGYNCGGTQVEGPATTGDSPQALFVSPNPFNPETEVRFVLETHRLITLKVYDIHGKAVRSLLSGHFGAGKHAQVWNGRDDAGHALSSGVYAIRLTGKGISKIVRVQLLK